jgi:hypothetical protein
MGQQIDKAPHAHHRGRGKDAVHARLLRVPDLKRGDGHKQGSYDPQTVIAQSFTQAVSQGHGHHPENQREKAQSIFAVAGQLDPIQSGQVIEWGFGFFGQQREP